MSGNISKNVYLNGIALQVIIELIDSRKNLEGLKNLSLSYQTWRHSLTNNNTDSNYCVSKRRICVDIRAIKRVDIRITHKKTWK